MVTLRDYQQDLVQAIRQAYAKGCRSPLVVLPTGGGKTTIFSYVTHGASSKMRCVYLLAHRAELVKQISMTLAKFGTGHQIIAPTKIVRQVKAEQFRAYRRSMVAASSRVYVCSVQTLVKCMDDLPPPDIIVVDEAHHLTESSTWGQVVAKHPEAKLLPVTATPCRLDGKGLGLDEGGFADEIVMGPTMRWLIEQGYLSNYGVYTPPTAVDLTGVDTRGGDYAKGKLGKAMDKPAITGDAVKHYKELAMGRRAIVFCASVEHSEHVAEKFSEAGVPSSYLDGALDPDERERRIKDFEAGRILVLTSCDVVSEGFDLPAIEVAILLRPTQSLSLFLQQVGRALRAVYADGYDLSTQGGRLAAIAAGPKPNALIIDHVGNIGRMIDGRFVVNHGLPDQDRVWTLDGVRRRKRAANDNGEEDDGDDMPDVAVQTCPKCFTIHRPAPLCPVCFHRYQTGGRTIQETDGTLIELTTQAREEMLRRAEMARLAAAAEAQRSQEKYARVREEQSCETLEDWIEIAKSRGYQYPVQWARKRHQLRVARGGKKSSAF